MTALHLRQLTPVAAATTTTATFQTPWANLFRVLLADDSRASLDLAPGGPASPVLVGCDPIAVALPEAAKLVGIEVALTCCLTPKGIAPSTDGDWLDWHVRITDRERRFFASRALGFAMPERADLATIELGGDAWTWNSDTVELARLLTGPGIGVELLPPVFGPRQQTLEIAHITVSSWWTPNLDVPAVLPGNPLASLGLPPPNDPAGRNLPRTLAVDPDLAQLWTYTDDGTPVLLAQGTPP